MSDGVETHTVSLRRRLRDVVEMSATRLIALSHEIHEDPEVAYDEYRASERIATFMETVGFEVRRQAYGVPTALEAVSGTGEFDVVVCAEYDALPELGHACGHNLIAASAVGASLALAAVSDEAGLRVRLLGTPAEESGGGKIRLLDAGAWDDATISLMAHPRAGVQLRCSDVGSQALERFTAAYSGRSAHAAADPERGLNALDAATVSQVAVGLLRQQLPRSARVGLIVTEGGVATNIIPSHTVLSVEVRSATVEELRDVSQRVRACLEAGAMATGCQLAIQRTELPYLPLRQEPVLAKAWDIAMIELGRSLESTDEPLGGSTDMGNVCQEVPSIQPFISVPGSTATLHTREFALDARGPGGDSTIVDAAFGLAAAALTVAVNRDTRQDLIARQMEREAVRASLG